MPRLHWRGLAWLLRVIVVTGCGLALIAAAGARAATVPPAPRKALILWSNHDSLPWQMGVRAGLVQRLEEAGTESPVNLFEERLDQIRLGPQASDEVWLRYLGQKYRGQRFDIILCEDNPACGFLEAHPQLFRGVPRRYVNFPAARADTQPHPVDLGNHYETQLALALRLFPERRRVILIGTGRPDVVEGLRRGWQTLAPVDRSLEVWSDDYTFEELYQRVAALPSDALIYYALVSRDRLGRTAVPREVLARLAKVASVPVVIGHRSLMGVGALGGYVVSGERLGRYMGDAILGREGSAGITRGGFAEYRFDRRVLDRWSLPQSLLPPGSIIENEPVSWWTQYTNLLPIVLGQSALVAGLIWAHLNRLRVARALKNSREVLKQAQAVARIGSWEVGPDGERVSLTQEACRLFDLAPGKHATLEQWVDRVHPDDRFAFEQAWQQALEGRDYDLTYRVNGHGEAVWIHARARFEFDAQGQLLRAVGTVQDVSDAKRYEAQLGESERRFRAMADPAPVLIWVAGHDGQFSWFNRAWLAFTGRALAQEQGRGWAQGIHPEDAERYAAQFEQHFLGREAFVMEYRLRRHDGQFRWLRDAGTPRFDEQGRFAGFIGSCFDITEQRLLETSLREKEHFMRSLVDIIPGMVGYWDAQLRCGFANKFYLERFGRTEAQMVGMSMQDVLGPDTFAGIEPLVRDALAGHPRHFQRTRIDAQGRAGHFWAHYLPNFIDGKVEGFFVLITDVTELKQVQIELESINATLEQRTREAESANRAKSLFLATISHEIRTPLNALIGTTHLLGHSELDARQREDLRTIEASGRNLLELVNDVLDFSKIEAGELQIDPQPFVLADVMRDLQWMFSPQATGKGIALTVGEMGDVDLPPLVGDAVRLRQCLVNLMGNALKFTDQGGVRLRVSVLAPMVGEERGLFRASMLVLRFNVADTGIGIAETHLDRLFTPFNQGDASTTRRHGGSGLGLSIVKRLAELMGGRIGVESVQGQGSRFWLDLPFGVSQAQERAARGHRHDRLLQLVLVQPPGEDRARVLALAQGLGWEVRTADHGAAMARIMADGRSMAPGIDCVVMDDQWGHGPGAETDGQALLALLRQCPEGHAVATVLKVDAAPPSGAVTVATGTPVPDGVLCAPVDACGLFNAVNEAMIARGHDRSRVLEATTLSGRVGQWLAGLRILVVDDSPLNLEVMARLLQREGALPTLRDSGREALALLDERPEGFDLVLMDLQMPDLDGCDTTKSIRLRPALATLPVIALTAGATAAQRKRARSHGMSDFLTKPVDPVRLVRALRQHVERAQDRTLPVMPSACVLPSRTEGWLELPGLAVDAARQRLGDNQALYRRLVDEFLKESETLVSGLESAIARHAQSEAAQALHRLRGQTGYVGALALTVQLGQLEDRARKGALMPSDVRVLQMSLLPLRQGLQAWRRTLADGDGGDDAPGQTQEARLDPTLLRKLHDDLDTRNMGAIRRFQQLRPALRLALTVAQWQSLDAAMTSLDFPVARDIVAALVSSASTACQDTS